MSARTLTTGAPLLIARAKRVGRCSAKDDTADRCTNKTRIVVGCYMTDINDGSPGYGCFRVCPDHIDQALAGWDKAQK